MTKPLRIHVMGAPGAGTTTLAKALAQQLQYDHFDADDYHWFTTDPLPYRRRRNPEHRCQLLSADLGRSTNWVLSGSLCGWGDHFAPQFDLILFCTAPADIRLARIRAREIARYGAERIEPGGDLQGVFVKFMDWAADYDTDLNRPRSLVFEQVWVREKCQCPIIQVNTAVVTVDEFLARFYE